MAKDKKKDNTEPKAENLTNGVVPGKSGIKAVLEQSLQSYEKLPMLEIIFEKFIRQLSTSLRNLTSEAVDISISEFTSLRFGHYFENLKNPYTIVVYKAVEWENLGLLIMENNMIFSFVDILLGGKKNNFQDEKKDFDRVLTSIEQGLARQLAELVLSELSSAFDQISPTTFSYDRLESNPNFVSICRPGDAVIVVKLKIEMDEQIKNIEILIPYKTIEPVKDQMQQVFLGDKFGSDVTWEKEIVKSLHEIDLDIEAVINNKITTVQQLANLKIGDTFMLDHKHNNDIIVRSGNIDLFTAKVGRVGDKLAVDLKEFIEE